MTNEMPRGNGPLPGHSRYNANGRHLKARYGCRVYKVIVDAGFTCPNRDGTVAIGGCTFCSNESFRPEAASRQLPVIEQVERGIAYLRRRYRAGKFIAYFQPFTNTYAPLERLVPLYESALAHPDVVGLAVGTRPDCVDEQKLSWFETLAKTREVTLEYGLESIYDSTLRRINRGHDFRCWSEAVDRTRGRGILIGAHLILGFPWESRDQMLAGADAISASRIDVLKLHHLHVVRHTAMGREYLEKPFPLPGFQEYLELVVDFLERLDPRVRIERLFGLAPDDQLIAPRWEKTKAEVQYAVEQRLEERDSWQGKLWRE
jgi:uncharacterized protein